MHLFLVNHTNSNNNGNKDDNLLKSAPHISDTFAQKMSQDGVSIGGMKLPMSLLDFFLGTSLSSRSKKYSYSDLLKGDDPFKSTR